MTDNANISPADKAALMAAKQGCLVMLGQNETPQPGYVMNGIHMTPEGAEKYVAAFEQRIALLEEGARAEREAVVEWQPIETVPKDGTWVLLIGGKTDEDDGSYKKARVNKTRPVVAFYVEGRIYWDEPYWAFSFWDGDWRSGYDNPTHWMPLPTPPSA